MSKESKSLKELNDKLLLNDQPKMSISEYRNMRSFEQAYKLEMERIASKRKVSMLVLVVIMLFIVVFGFLGGLDWILELIESVL